MSPRFPGRHRTSPLALMLGLLLMVGCTGPLQAHTDAPPPAPAESPSAPSEARALTGGFETDFASRYMWRGIRYSEGPVLQSTAWASTRGFTLSLWSNFVLTHEPQHGRCNEIDAYLSYTGHWKNLVIESSFQHYAYLNQTDSPPTGEVSLKLAYPLWTDTSVFTTHTWDVLEYGGSYFLEAGLEWEREWNPRTTAAATLQIGVGSGRFNEVYLGPHRTALTVLALEGGITHYVSDRLYLRPHLGFSALLDGELRDAVTGADSIYAGLAVGIDL